MLSKDDLRQSKRAQLTVLGVFFVTCFSILFYLEGKMEKFEKELEFGYREFYQRPFHYMLDPFTYVGLKDGIPVTELEPPNPNYKLSYEELLVTRFIDYYVWTLGGSSEIDSTFTRPRIDQTIEAFDGYVRNRLYYRLGREELDINPILLKDPALPPNTDPKSAEGQEKEKLLWNTIPYCTDPVLEESLHELGNRHGFLYVRGSHRNYRHVNDVQEKDITKMVATMPVKMAYLHDHNFLNFTRNNYRNPVYVSILCDPIQRKLRHFHTERNNLKNWNGDVKISDNGDTRWWTMTLEQCLANNHLECQYEGVTNVKQYKNVDILMQWSPRRVEWALPQFCDQSKCASLGVKADLDYVRQVISSEYAVVGTMENLEETLDVLEAKVPQFFKGIKEIYKAKKIKSMEPDWPKFDVSADIKTQMETKYASEVELYRYVVEELHKKSRELTGK